MRSPRSRNERCTSLAAMRSNPLEARIVVTGGSAELGRATAVAFARQCSGALSALFRVARSKSCAQ